MVGLKVLEFVSDGASCNRKFYSMHMQAEGKWSCSSQDQQHKINYTDVDHERPIFLISDVPHLLKTTRNSQM